MGGFAYPKMDGFRGERMIVLTPDVFSNFLSNPLIRRMHLTDIGFFPQAKNHFRERKDGIEEYIFLYCIDGEGSIDVKGRTHVLRKNEAFCIPGRTGHRYAASPENPWSILWVHFKGTDTALFPLEDCRIVQIESESASERMTFLFEIIFKALGTNYTEGNFAYISQALMLILSETYHREKKNSATEQNKHITNIIRYMDKHLDKILTLDEIAAEFGLSKSYISSIFQKYARHSVMSFFTNLKMKRACDLLRSSALYIYEIAQQLGYIDVFYFSRAFKKTVGVSPKKYRGQDYFNYR